MEFLFFYPSGQFSFSCTETLEVLIVVSIFLFVAITILTLVVTSTHKVALVQQDLTIK